MRRSEFRRAWSIARWVLVVAVVAFWFFALRPQALGGPAGFAVVSGDSMLPNMHTGDLVVVHSRDRYRVGDVIAYKVPEGEPAEGAQIIHRIVGGNAREGFVVQGDNRTAPDIWHPKPKDIVGSTWVHAPRLGRVVAWLHTPIVIGALAAFFVMGWILVGGSDEDERET